jgi:hypothetical protein
MCHSTAVHLLRAGVAIVTVSQWLRRILEIYEEQLRAADKDDISYTISSRAWFVRNGMRNRKVPWSGASGAPICPSAAENILLVGDTGRSKTGLACGLLLKALENSYRCQLRPWYWNSTRRGM